MTQRRKNKLRRDKTLRNCIRGTVIYQLINMNIMYILKSLGPVHNWKLWRLITALPFFPSNQEKFN
jgi:hypothetical protein